MTMPLMVNASRAERFDSMATNRWRGSFSAVTEFWDTSRPMQEISRHILRLPPNASTATTCGCRSSVTEIDGNSSINAQPSATAPEIAQAFDAERQRKIQIPMEIRAMPSQSRLRLISIRPYPYRHLGGRQRERYDLVYYNRCLPSAIDRTPIHRCQLPEGRFSGIGMASFAQGTFAMDSDPPLRLRQRKTFMDIPSERSTRLNAEVAVVSSVGARSVSYFPSGGVMLGGTRWCVACS